MILCILLLGLGCLWVCIFLRMYYCTGPLEWNLFLDPRFKYQNLVFHVCMIHSMVYSGFNQLLKFLIQNINKKKNVTITKTESKFFFFFIELGPGNLGY